MLWKGKRRRREGQRKKDSWLGCKQNNKGEFLEALARSDGGEEEEGQSQEAKLPSFKKKRGAFLTESLNYASLDGKHLKILVI